MPPQKVLETLSAANTIPFSGQSCALNASVLHLSRILGIFDPFSPACPTDGDWHALCTALAWQNMPTGSGSTVTMGPWDLDVVIPHILTYIAVFSPKDFLNFSPPAIYKYWYTNLETSHCFHTPYLYTLLGFSHCSLDSAYIWVPQQTVFFKVPKSSLIFLS